MKIKPRHFPYPVLSFFSDDMPNSQFENNIAVKIEDGCYIIDCQFVIENNDLATRVQKKEAEIMIHVEAPKTIFRKVYRTNALETAIKIPLDDIDGPVQVCTFILAAKHLPKYTNSDFHPDYGRTSFSLSKGDIMAIALEQKFTADNSQDESKKIPSIFVVVPSRKEDTTFDIDCYGEKIVVSISKEEHARFDMLARTGSDMTKVLSSMVIFPALTNVLEMLNQNKENLNEFEDKRWFRVLTKKLKEMDADVFDSAPFNESCSTLALKLIGNPLSGSLGYLEEIMMEG